MKAIAFLTATVIAMSAHGNGAQEFTTVAQIQAADVANVTCSDVASPTQTHIQLSFVKGQFDGYLTLTAVVPTKGISQEKFEPKQTEELEVLFSSKRVTVKGSLYGYYFSPDFHLVIVDKKEGMKGVYTFNDNDGTVVNNREVICGAVNYGITLH